MRREVFERFCAIAHERAGLQFRQGKETLVASRVARRMRALGLDSDEAYLAVLEADDNGEEVRAFIDAVTTNHTSFFRESEHFDILERLLVGWADEGQRRFRLWSCASSSGEEPYSIAMTALDALGQSRADVKILATDISTRALAAARRARYDARTVAPLEARGRKRFVARVEDERGEPMFEVLPEVRSLVILRSMNLSILPVSVKGPLDVIFCRNVLFYFGAALRDALLASLVSILRPGGVLFTGHAESLAGSGLGLRPLKPSVYQKPADGTGAEKGATHAG
jgi:chemotaxis protein methyltransferase CheR